MKSDIVIARNRLFRAIYGVISLSADYQIYTPQDTGAQLYHEEKDSFCRL
jgi:hypothetical protein